MANLKQEGSNIINVEYSTGRCNSQCEQCFVNFGQTGVATCREYANPSHRGAVEFAKEQAARYPKEVRYEPPIPVPEDYEPPATHEKLAYQIPESGKPGFYMIPTQSAWNKEYTVKSQAACIKSNTVENLEEHGEFPIFLRVSTMSDSSYAPVAWLKKIKDAWGDHCFFNSAIKSLKAISKQRKATIDVYHKLVVTTNPGHQEPLKMKAAWDRAKDKDAREKESKDWKKEVEKLPEYSPFETMGAFNDDRPMDFFHPKSVTDIGLPPLEDKIKFYRLRAFPTIVPHFESANPIVITQMRFKGLNQICEFARRYRLKLELHIPKVHWAKKEKRLLASAPINEGLIRAQFPFVKIVKSKGYFTEALLSTDPDDERNASPHSGKPTHFRFDANWYRPDDTYLFEDQPYVCDRLRGGCSFCGLCASLDGTGPTVNGIPFVNELNIKDGNLLAPLPGPENDGYIGFWSKELIKLEGRGKTKIEALPADVFAQRMQKLGHPADVPTVLRQWKRNPGPTPATPEECAAMVADAAAYLERGLVTGEVYFVEGWNTHENVATSLAFVVWSLLSRMAADGWSQDDAEAEVSRFVGEFSGDADVLDGVDYLWTMWDGGSPWNEVFGPVREGDE